MTDKPSEPRTWWALPQDLIEAIGGWRSMFFSEPKEVVALSDYRELQKGVQFYLEAASAGLSEVKKLREQLSQSEAYGKDRTKALGEFLVENQRLREALEMYASEEIDNRAPEIAKEALKSDAASETEP